MASCGKKWSVLGIKSVCALDKGHYGPSHLDEEGRPYPDKKLPPLPLGEPEE